MTGKLDTTKVHDVIAALDEVRRQWVHRVRMRLELPQGNAVVLAVLRSRAHRLLSASAIELRYLGRRSGRQYAVPVQYARAGGHLVVWPQHWQRSTWWRNFRTPQPVTVRLTGRLHEGTARVVDPDDPQWRSARQTYAARWPRMARRVTGPLVVISLRP
ncbi:deazaflavin-dependent oxidoreductase (nitroreductase family) [Geodermatophilus bullaregiensis]|uniref:nitroreductase/quinone reductase family protein n=1 Tax=Geodermatophilus bullaregiensis TaxID=1564160 RepID=UPI00195BA784|nr:nitroreductase/quinone reductase family protein [Geodermatophilus bullaregiensis]MBM7804461.1 deazaflavin-dependent oxidoreductase (nitroreductase family) [Geodermatophilus bullaregiensis]